MQFNCTGCYCGLLRFVSRAPETAEERGAVAARYRGRCRCARRPSKPPTARPAHAASSPPDERRDAHGVAWTVVSHGAGRPGGSTAARAARRAEGGLQPFAPWVVDRLDQTRVPAQHPRALHEILRAPLRAEAQPKARPGERGAEGQAARAPRRTARRAPRSVAPPALAPPGRALRILREVGRRAVSRRAPNATR